MFANICGLLSASGPAFAKHHHTLAGSTQLITFSPRYAPPEVAAAEAAGRTTHVALPSLDIWALGVMAFELLAERPAFPRFTSKGAIFASLLERPDAAPLPWEGPAGAGDLEKLRNLRGPVLACLSRDPAARPTAAALVATINELFGAAAAAPRADAPGGGDWGFGGARDENTWVTRAAPGEGMGVPGGVSDARAAAGGGAGSPRAASGGLYGAPAATSASSPHEQPARHNAATWHGGVPAAPSGSCDTSTVRHTTGVVAQRPALEQHGDATRDAGPYVHGASTVAAPAQAAASQCESHGGDGLEEGPVGDHRGQGVDTPRLANERTYAGGDAEVEVKGGGGEGDCSTCSVASTAESATRALSRA